MDLVGPFLENVKGDKYSLTIVDHFTRYPIAVPIPDKTAITVATALKTHLFMQFPFWPRKILSDNGKEFVNDGLQHIYDQLGIKKILTAHDNAQANQGERFHKYMNAAISCFIEKKHSQIQWEKYLDTVVYVYRCMTNNSTGYSPFYALFGRHPDRPLDMILNKEKEKFTNIKEYNDSITAALQEACNWEVMNDNQIQMALSNTDRNENLNKIEFNQGDNVWVWRKHNPNKLEWRFDGPHKITRKLAENSYEIQIAERTIDNRTYAAKTKKVSTRHLRLYKPFDDDFEDTAPSWLSEEEGKREEETIEMDIGMYCIIPHYCWIDVEQEDLPFCVGKIENIDKENNKIQVRRHGNSTNNEYGQQLPAWIHVTHRSKTIVYRKTRKDMNHYPYSNLINVPGKISYDYPIRLDWIQYYGFTLENGVIPEHIFRKLAADPDIPWTDNEYE